MEEAILPSQTAFGSTKSTVTFTPSWGSAATKKAYGEYGYINYTGVPSTTFDDEKKKAYLEIDVDERKQFYISRINVEGVGAPPRQQVLDELALRPGDIYNSR